MTGFALSVSIVCFHTPRRQLLALLDSLALACEQAREALPLTLVDITIVDNSERDQLESGDFSADNSVESAQLPSLSGCNPRVLHGHGNIGYGAAHNLAIGESSADYHLLLNPDVELDSDSLAIGLAYLAENASVALVSPAAVNSGERQYLCKRYPSVLILLLRGFIPAALRAPFARKLAAYEMRDLPQDRPSTNIPITSGCCMLCRGHPLREIGGFDERFFLYFEDFDLSLRLGRLGKLVHVPAMRINHDGGNAAGKGLRHIGMFVRSALRFFNQHGWKWI